MQRHFLKRVALSVALFAAASITTIDVATAGGPPHTMPANRVYPTYDIRLVTPPNLGRITVQVVNTQNGQLVTNAHVTMRHWVITHVKGGPIQPAMVELEPDGRGGYVCTREHVGHGEHVVVRAHIPGEGSGTWAELTIDT